MKRRQKNNLGSKESLETLIGERTLIEGELEFTGGLIVEGTIKGGVRVSDVGKASLILKNTGQVEGDVRVPHLEIDGVVTGDVYSDEYVALKENAKITGNVYYKLLEMAVGAEVNGQLVHQSDAVMDVVTKLPVREHDSEG